MVQQVYTPIPILRGLNIKCIRQSSEKRKENKMKNFALFLVVVGIFALGSSTAWSQRAGQSAYIQTGYVVSVQIVDLQDGNAIKGAVNGGAWGSILTRSSASSGRKDRNVAIGAIVGANRAKNQKVEGRLYTVEMPGGEQVQVATEQTELKIDDCASVEQSDGNANIRRMPDAACNPSNAGIMSDPSIVAEAQEEAAECVNAKQELVNADSDEALDRAARKIQILCYD
jgi:hypothetical protein